MSLKCPNCGASLKLFAEVEEKAEVEQLEFENVLTLFEESIRKNLAPILGEGCVKLEWKGKFDKRKFRQALIAVKGFGGIWIKGHFQIPFKNIGIEPNHE